MTETHGVDATGMHTAPITRARLAHIRQTIQAYGEFGYESELLAACWETLDQLEDARRIAITAGAFENTLGEVARCPMCGALTDDIPCSNCGPTT